MQKFAIIATLVIAAMALVAKSVPAHKTQPALAIITAPSPTAQPREETAETATPAEEEAALPEVSLPAPPRFSSTQEGMLDYANYVCDKVRLANRPASPELMAAAQAHAQFLADRGYGAYVDRYGRLIPQPSGHDGWGDGNAYRRAIKHGFTGSVSCDDPTSNIPGHRVTGEVIYCGPVPLEKAFESWQKHDSGHWIPLASDEFDVAGFGCATNRSGQNIYVGMFGNTTRTDPPMAAQPTAAMPSAARNGHWERGGLFGRQQIWVSDSQSQPYRQQPAYRSFRSCGPGGCP
jgi:uncharacterized protein YkwD